MTAYRCAPAARSLAATCLAAILALAALQTRAAETSVGQVSLMIGEARVYHSDGSVEALRRGSSILVGDRIETTGNGHVHVRFIDNAAVSVRPDSILEVQSYQYDAARPQANEVRLRVEHGTGRSISGAATEHDKNRFRLNTPIAAIGVRGTDFIVQTDARGMRATVADGTIVVGALGSACSAATLGPCAGNDTRVLSAEMGRMMVEVRPGDHVARVVPANGSLTALASAGADERAAARANAESVIRTAGLLAAEPTVGSQVHGNDRAAASVLAIAAVSVPDLASAPDQKGQLAWGRWTFASPGDDKIAVPFVVASLGRQITVADGTAGLFRANDPSNPDQQLRPSTEARVDFRLSRAQATFDTDGRKEIASVDGGTLMLDFSHRTFATALALSSASAGKSEFRMAGDVRSDGTFAVRDLDQHIAGAVSLDLKEAGYLFERATSGGMFRGKTLWGR